jgi:hypothetical protein
VLGYLSESEAQARLEPRAAGLVLASVVVVALTSCTSEPDDDFWAVTECSADDSALIDHTLGELSVLEAYMDEALGRRFIGDLPPFAGMVDALAALRAQGDLGCARPREGLGDTWRAVTADGGQLVLVNVDGIGWLQAMEEWTSGREYGDLSPEEVVEQLEHMDSSEFAVYERTARSYFQGAARACHLLAHEGAHLETDCCGHVLGEDDGEVDFVKEVGTLAYHGIYWERWHPEMLWLEQQYREVKSR